MIERDYARQPLTAAELTAIFAADEVAPFLNTRHATYKARGWANQLPPPDELMEAILAEPNLLRRPITRRGQQVVIGFDPDKLRQLLNHA
jgi:arsenate reductase-like glutaredoxin family protein